MKKIIFIIVFFLSVLASYGQFGHGKNIYGNLNVYENEWIHDSLWLGHIDSTAEYYLLAIKNGIVDTINVWISGDTLFIPEASIDTLYAGYVSVDTIEVDYIDADSIRTDYLQVDTTMVHLLVNLSKSDTLLTLSGDTMRYRLDYWDTTTTQIFPRDTNMIINCDTVYAIDGNRVLWQTSVGLYLGDNSGIVSTGNYNTGLGIYSLYRNTTGIQNTAVGYAALQNNVTTGNNVAVGFNALTTAGGGDGNTAVGAQNMAATTTGDYNTAVGYSVLSSNVLGSYNVAVGSEAAVTAKNSSYIVSVGERSSYSRKGNNCIYLGYYAGKYGSDSTDNLGYIGSHDFATTFAQENHTIARWSESPTDSSASWWQFNSKLNVQIVPSTSSDTLLAWDGYRDVNYRLEGSLHVDSAEVAGVADSSIVSAYADSAYVSFHSDVADSSVVSAYADSAYVSYHADLADSSVVSAYADSAYVSYHSDVADSSVVSAYADSAYVSYHADLADSSIVSAYADSAYVSYHADLADSSIVSAYADSAYVSYHADLADSSIVSAYADSAYVSYHADLADSATNCVYADSSGVSGHADLADSATNCVYADSSGLAGHATTSDLADSATNCVYADSAGLAGNAATADFADLIDSTHCYQYLTIDTINGCSPVVFDVAKASVTGDTIVVGNIMEIIYSDTIANGDSILLCTAKTIIDGVVTVDSLGIVTGSFGFFVGSDGAVDGISKASVPLTSINIGVLAHRVYLVQHGTSVYIKNSRAKKQRISYAIKML